MWDCAAKDQRERPKTRKKCGAGSAQRLLVDLELLGDIGLGDAESRGVLNESALVSGRHIFGGHFPLRIALLRDARGTTPTTFDHPRPDLYRRAAGGDAPC